MLWGRIPGREKGKKARGAGTECAGSGWDGRVRGSEKEREARENQTLSVILKILAFPPSETKSL